MTHKKLSLFAVTLVSTWMLTGTPAQAQIIIGGGFADENVNGLQLAAPGNMVGAGLLTAQEAAERARARPNITEPEESDPSWREQFVSDAMTQIFDQIRAFVAFFGNRLAARAGLTPLFEDDGTAIDATGGLLSGLFDSVTDDLLDDLTPDDTKDPTDTTDDRGGRTRRKVNRIQ